MACQVVVHTGRYEGAAQTGIGRRGHKLSFDGPKFADFTLFLLFAIWNCSRVSLEAQMLNGSYWIILSKCRGEGERGAPDKSEEVCQTSGADHRAFCLDALHAKFTM